MPSEESNFPKGEIILLTSPPSHWHKPEQGVALHIGQEVRSVLEICTSHFISHLAYKVVWP